MILCIPIPVHLRAHIVGHFRTLSELSSGKDTNTAMREWRMSVIPGWPWRHISDKEGVGNDRGKKRAAERVPLTTR